LSERESDTGEGHRFFADKHLGWQSKFKFFPKESNAWQPGVMVRAEVDGKKGFNVKFDSSSDFEFYSDESTNSIPQHHEDYHIISDPKKAASITAVEGHLDPNMAAWTSWLITADRGKKETTVGYSLSIHYFKLALVLLHGL